MPTHTEQRILPYTPEQMFTLVGDIAKYPEFLPWCSSARIIRQEKEFILAELTIGYKMIRERFVSRVQLDHKNKIIDVTYVSGPLKALRNEWKFSPLDEKKGKKKCMIDFYVHFEFSNPFLSTMMNMFFDIAFRRMVGAFEKRADDIYGK